MTKSIIAERKKFKRDATYAQERKKFLGEFGIKDTWNLTDKQHDKLMEDHFYWIDISEHQGYHISDDIEGTKRELTSEETLLYQSLYYDATKF